MSPWLSQTVSRVIAFLCFVRAPHPLTHLPVCPPTHQSLDKHLCVFWSYLCLSRIICTKLISGKSDIWLSDIHASSFVLFMHQSNQEREWMGVIPKNLKTKTISWCVQHVKQNTLPRYWVRVSCCKMYQSKWKNYGKQLLLVQFVWLFMLVFTISLHAWITMLPPFQNRCV